MIDVCEHAVYLDFQNKKVNDVDKFLSLVDWAGLTAASRMKWPPLQLRSRWETDTRPVIFYFLVLPAGDEGGRP